MSETVSGTTGTIRVLHVDDEPEFADLAAGHLERADDRFDIETATRASDGLNHLADDDFDCVISDYDMPGRNGIEFLEAVREDHPDLPFILFTGQGSEAVASDAISAGVTDYLQKETGTEQYQLLAKRVRDAVEHQHAKASYREIFEAIPDGVVIHDPDDGAFVDLNSTYAEMFGYERAELLDAGFEVVHPGEPPYTVETARQRLQQAAKAAAQTFEWPGVTRDGEQFWAEVHLTPTRLHGEDRILAVVRDVTDRRQRERELERTRDRMQHALEYTDSIIYEIECDTGQVERYGTYEPAFDLPPEAVPTWEDHLERVVHPDDEEAFEEFYRQLVDGEQDGGVLEYRTDPANGPVRWIRDTIYADTDVESANGNRLAIGVAVDITAQKEREQQLARQNERLAEFADIVSHELQNPLAVADGNLSLAREESDSERLATVARAHDRMQSLIDDLLTLAREGERVGDVEPVEFAAFVDECWRNVDTAEATLDIEVDSATTLQADPGRLQEVLENLMQNAVRHGAEDVTLTVGDLDTGFYVEDDGPGIPESERERIFESGYSTSDDGTGFGLSIVEEVVEAHGWAIDVIEGEEGGARFEVTGVDVAGC